MSRRTTVLTLVLAAALPFLVTPVGPANATRHAAATPPAHSPATDPTRSAPAGPASAVPSPSPARTTWRWPLDGTPEILRRFSPPPAPWLAGHRGVDLAAPPTAAVVSAGPGSIGFAGRVAGRGVVTVNHPGGLRTTYLPLTPTVRAGDLVSAGDPLGTLTPGPPHCPKSCLHWGLRHAATYLDPLLLLARTPIRLLPFWRSGPPTPPLLPGPRLPSPATRTPQMASPAPPSRERATPTRPHALSDTSPTHLAASPNSTRLPSVSHRSATTALPHPLVLLAPLGALILLALLVRLLRKRTHRHRSPGKHWPRPATRGQHRKQPRR